MNVGFILGEKKEIELVCSLDSLIFFRLTPRGY